MRKRWSKYILAVLITLLTVNLGLTYATRKVAATEAGTGEESSEGSIEIDDNTIQPWGETGSGDSYMVSIVHDLNGGAFASEGTYDYTFSGSEETFSITVISEEPVKDGFLFTGWQWNGKLYQKDEVIQDLAWADYNAQTITFTAQWEQDMSLGGTITESGTYQLVAGQEYTLGEGTWTVDSDTSQYAGSISFYVAQNGTYTFTKQ